MLCDDDDDDVSNAYGSTSPRTTTALDGSNFEKPSCSSASSSSNRFEGLVLPSLTPSSSSLLHPPSKADDLSTTSAFQMAPARAKRRKILSSNDSSERTTTTTTTTTPVGGDSKPLHSAATTQRLEALLRYFRSNKPSPRRTTSGPTQASIGEDSNKPRASFPCNDDGGTTTTTTTTTTHGDDAPSSSCDIDDGGGHAIGARSTDTGLMMRGVSCGVLPPQRTVSISIFQKPRGSGGKWVLVNHGERVRVAKTARGKALRLLVQCNFPFALEHVDIGLVDVISGKMLMDVFTRVSEKSRVVRGNTAAEVHVTLNGHEPSVRCEELCFLVDVLAPLHHHHGATIPVGSWSVIFCAHNDGKYKRRHSIKTSGGVQQHMPTPTTTTNPCVRSVGTAGGAPPPPLERNDGSSWNRHPAMMRASSSMSSPPPPSKNERRPSSCIISLRDGAGSASISSPPRGPSSVPPSLHHRLVATRDDLSNDKSESGCSSALHRRRLPERARSSMRNAPPPIWDQHHHQETPSSPVQSLFRAIESLETARTSPFDRVSLPQHPVDAYHVLLDVLMDQLGGQRRIPKEEARVGERLRSMCSLLREFHSAITKAKLEL